MRMAFAAASFLALSFSYAADVGLDHDPYVSLLQLRASKKDNNTHAEDSVDWPRKGHHFGCTGRTIARSVVPCGIWGDVHQHKKYNGAKGDDFNGNGWFWLAKSKDNSFLAQTFVRTNPFPNGGVVSTASHYAFKFGDHTVFLDRDPATWPYFPNWIFTYYINGEKVDEKTSPMDEPPFYWVFGMGNSNQKGLSVGSGGYLPSATTSCFEYNDVSVWTGTYAGGQRRIPYDQWTTFEMEVEEDFIDLTVGQCAGVQTPVDPGDMLVTKEQNDKICRENKMTEAECLDPAPPPAVPTKDELCEANGVDMQHAEDLCADQKDHGSDIYEGCVYDVCANPTSQGQEDAAAGAEFEAEVVNPEATCVVDAVGCEACDICASAVSVDLSTVVQNNLGGAGPDVGAEEIRYKNAVSLDGRSLDVVLTTDGDYKTPKPEKNGVTGDGFGRFLLKLKASLSFKFEFQDAETGDPVAVKDLALSFYDLDEAKNGRQQETVTVCGAKEAYTTSNTELVHKAEGLCHSFTSSQKGTGKDNPTDPADITMTQAARTVTFEFHSRASITFSAALTRSGRNMRPFLFAFKPVVACGASDAETRCSD